MIDADVLGEVPDRTGAGEHHVAARLVAGEAIRRLRQRPGARTEEEPQRIVLIDEVGIELPRLDELCDHAPHAVRRGERLAHGEHHQYTDAACAGGGQHPIACRRVDEVVPHHQHVVPVIARVEALPERVVALVGGERLAGREEADLAGIPEGEELRHDDVAGVLEVRDPHAVDEEEIDAVGAQTLEALLHGEPQALSRDGPVAVDG